MVIGWFIPCTPAGKLVPVTLLHSSQTWMEGNRKSNMAKSDIPHNHIKNRYRSTNRYVYIHYIILYYVILYYIILYYKLYRYYSNQRTKTSFLPNFAPFLRIRNGPQNASVDSTDWVFRNCTIGCSLLSVWYIAHIYMWLIWYNTNKKDPIAQY
jgi:hypothetical protein